MVDTSTYREKPSESEYWNRIQITILTVCSRRHDNKRAKGAEGRQDYRNQRVDQKGTWTYTYFFTIKSITTKSERLRKQQKSQI